MPGSVVDLSVPGSRLPDPIVVDTNLIVERLIVPFLGALPVSAAANPARARWFFRELVATNGTGIVTPTAFGEVVHVAIATKYRHETTRLGAAALQKYGRPIRGWHDLYKADATILQGFRGDLDRLRQLLIANGLLFVTPDELGPIASGRGYDEELVRLVGTYGLDSNDALILMEAQRYGVTDVITLDADMQRAQADFDIYTWL